MKDRQPSPGKEGRVLITPENGGSPYYARIAMADEPLEAGTPWAKSAVLTDATAAELGLSGDVTPNTAFRSIARNLKKLEVILPVSASAWTGSESSGYTVKVTITEFSVYSNDMVIVMPAFSDDPPTRINQSLAMACVNQTVMSSSSVLELIAFRKKPPYDFDLRLVVMRRI